MQFQLTRSPSSRKAVTMPRRHLPPAKALTASKREVADEIRLIRDEQKAIVKDPGMFEQGVNQVYEDLLKSVMLGFAFEFHRNLKIGLWDSEVGIARDTDHKIVDEPGLDIFGQPPLKKPPDCVCPECHRSLTAARFAPHLEKCMGMGRNSSRIAQRRIANNSSSTVVMGEDADDIDDADWTVGSDRRRKKKERTTAKRIKPPKPPRNGTVNHTSDNTVTSSLGCEMNVSYEGMTVDEKRNLLAQICGVISEHTKRLCTRSMRCPQHSDEQRRSVRSSLLNSEGSSEGSLGYEPVDVDTYEEGDAQNMRDQLGRSWEQEHSSTNSPADSCSTGSSTQSKKREKPSKKCSKSKKSAMNYAD